MALTLFSLCKSCRSLKQWKGSRQHPGGTCFDPQVKDLRTCSRDCEKKNKSFKEGKEEERKGGERVEEFRGEMKAVIRTFNRL